MSERPRLLVVEDDPGLQRQLKWAYEAYEVLLAADRPGALAALEAADPPVVTLDLGLPPDPDGVSEGLALLEEILARRPHAKVIVASGHGDRESARRAIALGAFDFYQKPIDIDELGFIVGRAFHVANLEAENRRLQARTPDTPLGAIVTGSPEMLKVCAMVERVAATNVSVLLLGASGTGKEVLARALHAASPRAAGPFVAINCAAIPENLLEAELFGYERGAFTGAVKTTEGKIELAKGGTLFLDEVGDIPLPLQVKLLRFIQERVIERVGGRRSIPVDVRIVCATHQNLKAMIADGRFREDLFYRIAEVTITIPPLKDRPGDALLLAHHFLQKHAGQRPGGPVRFGPSAVAAINLHSWPGNVRELENRVKRAIIMADGPAITAEDLDLADSPDLRPVPLKEARAQSDRRAILAALAASGGSVSQAARALGISRPTLYDLMRELGIDQPA
ncbi:MAG: PEP-CTERM-box response regulator transcription factor [Sphingomonadaceae bacterium]|uniref:PEP-CTERM-box response regulator transcription factor n=1 Tax=Thermaurantiacus sp. TaxID=2820283 RepID=UPI00298F2687|nr:PEP-CTERM-box response regulator transcription factor [Thermaurantiacus sp.]MCS6987363.1 PEP-CTERM-box response regulator transcription factor [Sphingomonadaceae bacterium]MDW8414584.1 PEP-CTERM-box response regulator transcription factor [Thermaurantiacus sp.]